MTRKSAPFLAFLGLGLASCAGLFGSQPPAQGDPPIEDATDAGGPPASGDAGAIDPTEDAGAGEDLTWFRDVLPVAQRRCMSCHRGGGIGTFSLEDARTARSLANDMAVAVYDGVMPPWPPSTDCRPLHNARLIDDDEVDLFVRWADLGAPLGDPDDAPPPLEGPPGLADVDAELPLAVPYTPDFDDGPDDYRCFVLDPQLTSTEHIVAIEYAPDRGEMVHHVLLFRASRAEAQAKDDDEAGPGWTCFGGPGVSSSQGIEAADTLGAWAPGVNVSRYPDGTGLPLRADDVVVIQIHYNGDNIWQPTPPADQTSIKLSFADSSVASATLLPGPVQDFEIPPGAVDHEASLSIPIPYPGGLPLYGVMPHMHRMGTRISVSASGVGDSCLVDIPRWDFDWQEAYFFEGGPIQVPFGATASVTCAWDNPTDQTVTWGEGTDDEMCLVYFYVVL